MEIKINPVVARAIFNVALRYLKGAAIFVGLMISVFSAACAVIWLLLEIGFDTSILICIFGFICWEAIKFIQKDIKHEITKLSTAVK